jgi:hypothetical protein
VRIRPAALGVATVHAFGLDRRKLAETPYGKFLVNPASQSGQRMLRGTFELAIVKIMRLILKLGMTFVDTDANEGYFSIVASQAVARSGWVIAVVPQSRLQQVILSNGAANGCGIELETLLDHVGLKRVDLMKIDVEGAESDILTAEAARKTLRLGLIAAIIVEMHPDVFARRESFLEEFDGNMKSCGYVREPPQGA